MEDVMENSNVTGVDGFWGPITSNIDWCEGNYEVTYYVAEFCRSNFVFLHCPFSINVVL